MTINLADNNPRIAYALAEGVEQSAFAVPFEFFDSGDLRVYVDSVLMEEGVDYTVSGGDGSTGDIAMSVTGAAGGTVVVLLRRIPIERVTDFSAGADINRAALNEQLDILTAMVADLDDQADLSIHASDGDIASMALPSAADRANKYLSFDADGNAVAYESIAERITISTIGPSGGIEGDLWFKLSS